MTNAEVSATQECTQTQTQYYTQSQWDSQQTIVAGETRNPWGRIYVQRMRPNIPESESSTQCGLHEYHPEGTDTFHGELSGGKQGEAFVCHEMNAFFDCHYHTVKNGLTFLESMGRIIERIDKRKIRFII